TLRHSLSADEGRDVPAVEQYARRDRAAVETDPAATRDLLREPRNTGHVVPRQARLARSKCDRPIERPRVEKHVTELLCDQSGNGALSGTRGAVDGDRRLARRHDSTSISAPSARSVPTKRGKLVAIVSASSTIETPSATSPRTHAVMAMRWSPWLATRAA